jgi:uncharacterized protein YqgV (UPF0045/DUF77 family)
VKSISAQVSLYPIRRVHFSGAIDDTLRIFRTFGLQVEPGTMSTVVTGDIGDVFRALREALQQAIEKGDVVMTVTFSNACPLTHIRSDQGDLEARFSSTTRTNLAGLDNDERSEVEP